jgi:hypothetical protein
MKFGQVAFAVLMISANFVCANAEAANPETCVAIDQAEMKAGRSVYLLSSEFTIVDPASRDAAGTEWTKYATGRGFDSVGCDPNSYHDEVAGLPPDTKVVASNWKPSRGAIMAGADAIKSGKRNFRNGSSCVQNIKEAVQNKCEYPVKIGFCFAEANAGSGDTFDKTCQAQNFGTTEALPPNQEAHIGIYHYVYFFACEAPAAPQSMLFDGSGITGVCSAP